MTNSVWLLLDRQSSTGAGCVYRAGSLPKPARSTWDIVPLDAQSNCSHGTTLLVGEEALKVVGEGGSLGTPERLCGCLQADKMLRSLSGKTVMAPP